MAIDQTTSSTHSGADVSVRVERVEVYGILGANGKAYAPPRQHAADVRRGLKGAADGRADGA